MKKLKQLYLIPILLAIIFTGLTIYLTCPPEWYGKVILIALIPTLTISIGFRIITYQRIKTIRNQLYQIFETLEEFDVDEPKKVNFEKSPFPIFNELNEYLVELIERIHGNYQANKQFTQNASHELQTPLAIIKGNVEILLQSPRIGEKEMESLAIVLQNTNRLSKLNSALILLSKIENQRFSDTLEVDFEKVAEEILKNFKDLINIQGIQVIKDYQANFLVEMSESLAEILIANLVQNAIRHNIENNPTIKIEINKGSLTISNPGNPPNTDTNFLFKRFKRNSEVEESLGLGLSIVKRICEQSNLNIQYQYLDGQHRLELSNN